MHTLSTNIYTCLYMYEGDGYRLGLPSSDNGQAGLWLVIASGILHSYIGTRLTAFKVPNFHNFELWDLLLGKLLVKSFLKSNIWLNGVIVWAFSLRAPLQHSFNNLCWGLSTSCQYKWLCFLYPFWKSYIYYIQDLDWSLSFIFVIFSNALICD